MGRIMDHLYMTLAVDMKNIRSNKQTNTGSVNTGYLVYTLQKHAHVKCRFSEVVKLKIFSRFFFYNFSYFCCRYS